MGRGVRKLVGEGLGVDNLQENKGFYNLARDRLLARTEIAAERFKETKTFEFPTWQYGEPIGKLLKLEVEDGPRFWDIAWIDMDSARTAFLSVDMQIDFCGTHGDMSTPWVMIYPSLRQLLRLSVTVSKQYAEPI